MAELLNQPLGAPALDDSPPARDAAADAVRLPRAGVGRSAPAPGKWPVTVQPGDADDSSDLSAPSDLSDLDLPPAIARFARAAESARLAALPWHGEDLLLGIKVRAHFFSPPAPDADLHPSVRSLPILAEAALPLQLRSWGDGSRGPRPGRALPEGDDVGSDAGAPFVLGPLQARPAALWRHGGGLISVWIGGPGGRAHDESHWRSRLPAHRMIESVVCAMVVSAHTGRPTVAVLRAANAIYQFDPGLGVLAFLTEQWPAAWQHALAQRHPGGAAAAPSGPACLMAGPQPAEPPLSVVEFARFCEPRLREMVASARRAVALRTGE